MLVSEYNVFAQEVSMPTVHTSKSCQALGKPFRLPHQLWLPVPPRDGRTRPPSLGAEERKEPYTFPLRLLQGDSPFLPLLLRDAYRNFTQLIKVVQVDAKTGVAVGKGLVFAHFCLTFEGHMRERTLHNEPMSVLGQAHTIFKSHWQHAAAWVPGPLAWTHTSSLAGAG